MGDQGVEGTASSRDPGRVPGGGRGLEICGRRGQNVGKRCLWAGSSWQEAQKEQTFAGWGPEAQVEGPPQARRRRCGGPGRSARLSSVREWG